MEEEGNLSRVEERPLRFYFSFSRSLSFGRNIIYFYETNYR